MAYQPGLFPRPVRDPLPEVYVRRGKYWINYIRKNVLK